MKSKSNESAGTDESRSTIQDTEKGIPKDDMERREQLLVHSEIKQISVRRKYRGIDTTEECQKSVYLQYMFL